MQNDNTKKIQTRGVTPE